MFTFWRVWAILYNIPHFFFVWCFFMIRLGVSRVIQKWCNLSISYQEAKWNLFKQQYFMGTCSITRLDWGQSLQWAGNGCCEAQSKCTAAGSISLRQHTAESLSCYSLSQWAVSPTFNSWLRLGCKGLNPCVSWDHCKGPSQCQSSLWDR